VNHLKKRLQNSTHYFGFQVVSTAVGYILLYFVLSVVFYIFAFGILIPAFGQILISLIVPTFCAFLVIALPISLVESHIITKQGGKELSGNFLFYLADCVFLAFHVLRGLILIPVRALLAMIFGALYFARLDIYMFPGELKPLDWGSVSFNSMVYLEHKYNNPIAVVFRENLRREIQMVLPPEKQAIKNLQNKFKQAILLHQNETLQRQTKRIKRI